MRAHNLFYGMVLSCLLACLGSLCFGATAQTSSVLGSGGGVYSNATFKGVGTIGQGTPLGHTFNMAKDNYSGFLHTYVDRPDLDNDMDGIADENDTDDDNDGLSDTSEVTGSSFDPETETDIFNADTDSDGTSDGEESGAGTNPQDPDSQLLIIGIDRTSGEEVVEWKSRQGKTYEVLRTSNIFDIVSSPETTEVVTVTSGGVGPFLETTTTSTNLSTGNVVYYRVKVKP